MHREPNRRLMRNFFGNGNTGICRGDDDVYPPEIFCGQRQYAGDVF